MALAKYREDIVDRYYEENSERFDALFALRDFEKEWRRAAHTESAAVAEKMTSGRFFENRMAFIHDADTDANDETTGSISSQLPDTMIVAQGKRGTSAALG